VSIHWYEPVHWDLALECSMEELEQDSMKFWMKSVQTDEIGLGRKLILVELRIGDVATMTANPFQFQLKQLQQWEALEEDVDIQDMIPVDIKVKDKCFLEQVDQ
jgi:hypothetical protein